MSERHTSLCDEMRDHQYGCICGAWDGKEPSNAAFARYLAAAGGGVMDIDTNGRGIAQIDNSEPPTCECCGDVYTMETGDEPTPFCDRCAHDVLEKQTAELTEARATIATLTHRAEVAEAAVAEHRNRYNALAIKFQQMGQSESNKALRLRALAAEKALAGHVPLETLVHDNDACRCLACRLSNALDDRDAALSSAALWRERCNRAEARSDAVTTELRRIYSAICRGQTRSDDHHAVAQAVIDEYHDVQRERDECCERDANVIAHREFMAAGWRRLARHYQSCHLAGHACLRETHRKRAEAALARDAAIANAEAVLSTAEALRVERDRMRDYWRSEAEMRGACLVEIDQLRAKLARAEGVVGVVRDALEHPSADRLNERDAIRAALATYEEG